MKPKYDNKKDAQRSGHQGNGNHQNGGRHDDCKLKFDCKHQPDAQRGAPDAQRSTNQRNPPDAQRGTAHKPRTLLDGRECDPVKMFDKVLEDMAAEMDKGFMAYGKAVAELFRAMCDATVKLPNMEIHTEAMSIFRDDDGLTVIFTPDRKKDAEGKKRDAHPCGPKFDDDEEEGWLYDDD